MKDFSLPARLAMAEENPDAREAKLRNARRRLVFDGTHEQSAPSKDEIERQFAQERAEHLEEKQAKWNFDFKAERPLEGQWRWERMAKSGSKQAGSAASARDAPGSADASAEGVRGDAQKQAS